MNNSAFIDESRFGVDGDKINICTYLIFTTNSLRIADIYFGIKERYEEKGFKIKQAYLSKGRATIITDTQKIIIATFSENCRGYRTSCIILDPCLGDYNIIYNNSPFLFSILMDYYYKNVIKGVVMAKPISFIVSCAEVDKLVFKGGANNEDI